MKENIIQTKSFNFAVRIVRFCRSLQETKKEFVLSKQLLRSGTSIGANTRESRNAQSKADFLNKLNIALKEADESMYWLDLLFASELMDEKMYQSLKSDNNELIAILVSIIKTLKGK